MLRPHHLRGSRIGGETRALFEDREEDLLFDGDVAAQAGRERFVPGGGGFRVPRGARNECADLEPGEPLVIPAERVHTPATAWSIGKGDACLSKGAEAGDEHPQHDDDRPSDQRHDRRENRAVGVH
jgi:hypothetical protein